MNLKQVDLDILNVLVGDGHLTIEQFDGAIRENRWTASAKAALNEYNRDLPAGTEKLEHKMKRLLAAEFIKKNPKATQEEILQHADGAVFYLYKPKEKVKQEESVKQPILERWGKLSRYRKAERILAIFGAATLCSIVFSFSIASSTQEETKDKEITSTLVEIKEKITGLTTKHLDSSDVAVIEGALDRLNWTVNNYRYIEDVKTERLKQCLDGVAKLTLRKDELAEQCIKMADK